jgi:hypothetical protein
MNRGGGRTVDEHGKRVRKQDQSQKKAEPFLHTMKRNLPIAMIAGNIDFQSEYPLFCG